MSINARPLPAHLIDLKLNQLKEEAEQESNQTRRSIFKVIPAGKRGNAFIRQKKQTLHDGVVIGEETIMHGVELGRRG